MVWPAYPPRACSPLPGDCLQDLAEKGAMLPRASLATLGLSGSMRKGSVKLGIGLRVTGVMQTQMRAEWGSAL